MVRGDELEEAEMVLSEAGELPDNFGTVEDAPASDNSESPPYLAITIILCLLYMMFFVLMNNTSLEIPNLLKSIAGLPLEWMHSAGKSIFLSFGALPESADQFAILINLLLIPIIVTMVIGNRITLKIVTVAVALFVLASSPWVAKSIGKGGYTMALAFIQNPVPLIFMALACVPVSWALHLIESYSIETGKWQKVGAIWVKFVTWITIILLLLSYLDNSDLKYP